MSHLFDHITETGWLKIISSYINHQIDPQLTIPLEYLEHLDVTDLDAVTPDMFEIREYTKEDLEHMAEALSVIITKREEQDEASK